MNCEHSNFGEPCEYPQDHRGSHSWEIPPVGPPPADPLVDAAWEAYCVEVIDPLTEALGLR